MDLKERIIQEFLMNCRKHDETLIAAGLRKPHECSSANPAVLEVLRNQEIHILRNKLRSSEVALQGLLGLPGFEPAVGQKEDL